MTTITEEEFLRILNGIIEDADLIHRHNPIGTRAETLLWMMMGCLATYLSLSELETPCFSGRPDADTYREAIVFIVGPRQAHPFEIAAHLDRLEKA